MTATTNAARRIDVKTVSIRASILRTMCRTPHFSTWHYLAFFQTPNQYQYNTREYSTFCEYLLGVGMLIYLSHTREHLRTFLSSFLLSAHCFQPSPFKLFFV